MSNQTSKDNTGSSESEGESGTSSSSKQSSATRNEINSEDLALPNEMVWPTFLKERLAKNRELLKNNLNLKKVLSTTRNTKMKSLSKNLKALIHRHKSK